MAGTAAFILSFAIGIVNGAGFVMVLLRALAFATVFFAMGTGAWVLINKFVPELLFPESSGGETAEGNFSAPASGTRVNITVGDTSGAAVPEKFHDSHNSSELGSLPDLVSGAIDPGAGARAAREAAGAQGMDDTPQEGYTKQDNAAFTENAEQGSFSVNIGEVENGGSTDGFGLPDLDAMAGSFSAVSAEPESSEQAETPDPVRSPTGNKPQKFEGDFNPKEIAAGIRTVLEKDKQG
jgi:hypothetical protein